jgi:hypothetical protein
MTITQSGFKKDVTGTYIVKDPSAIITYTVDWSQWLPTTSNISTSTWTLSTVSGDGANALAKVSDGITNANKYTYIEVQKGTDGNTYVAKNTVVTTDGTTDVRRFRIRVQDRYL